MGTEDDINVLIVEDEPPMARFINQLVERRAGFHVCRVCENAEDALNFFMHSAEQIDLVLSDIRMESMSGLELFERIRKYSKDIQLIIISGYRLFEYAQQGIGVNIAAYIVKPLDPVKFNEVLNGVRNQCLQNKIRRKQNEIIEAMRQNNARRMAEILPPEVGICAIYQGGDRSQLINLFAAAEDVLVMQYKEMVFLFCMKKEREIVKILMKLHAKTLYAVTVSKIPVTEQIISELKRLREYVQKRVVLGRHVYEADEDIVPFISRIERSNIPDTASLRLSAASGNWLEFKREISARCRQWTQQKSTLFSIKQVLSEIGMTLDGEEIMEDEGTCMREELIELLHHAETYEEMERSLMMFLQEILPDDTKRSVRDEEELYQKIRNLIMENMNENYTLSQISDLFGISQPYIRKIFNRYTNTSYSKYVMHVKLQFAKDLIQKNPQILIKDIADRIGMEQFYFSTVFKNSEGVSPSEYKTKFQL